MKDASGGIVNLGVQSNNYGQHTLSFIDKISELRLPPISFVGHGIGLYMHEDPYLGKYDDYELKE